MGMTQNQKAVIRAIAENKLSDARKYAKACCEEDKTQKNAAFVRRYKNILENEAAIMEMPFNIKGMAQMEDVSSFREKRYFLSEREAELFQSISNMNEAGLKLMELGIPYLNAILLTGESGTGKTTFGRYVAYKLGLPFLYINFSYLIDSYLGKTAQNLRNIFDFARMNKCILMLDEIDCIAQSRKGADSGSDREFNNTTISLLQELDKIQNDSIIIGATNVPKTIDPAVKRRFALHHEVRSLKKQECPDLMRQYLDDIGMEYERDSLGDVTDMWYGDLETLPQALVLNNLITSIADAVINKREVILFD